MSKQITAKELSEIVSRLLADTKVTMELDSEDKYLAFMTDIAKVICDHCGGEVRYDASTMDGVSLVGIHGNDSMPDPSGGIWSDYDQEAPLFD